MRMKFVQGDKGNRSRSKRGRNLVRGERKTGQSNGTKREIEVPGRRRGARKGKWGRSVLTKVMINQAGRQG
jgi:DNA primase catalytic subunit